MVQEKRPEPMDRSGALVDTDGLLISENRNRPAAGGNAAGGAGPIGIASVAIDLAVVTD